MKKERFDDYEDEDFGRGGYIKNKNRDARRRDREKEMRHGGRASRSEWLASMEEEVDTFDIEKIDINPPVSPRTDGGGAKTRPAPTVYSAPSMPTTPTQTNTGGFTFGPNTHIVKGKQIDFDRVANIEKVENTHNNKLTYGIKFVFTGKKG